MIFQNLIAVFCHYDKLRVEYRNVAMTQVPVPVATVPVATVSVSRKEVFGIVAQEKGENPWNSRKFVVSLPPNKNANEREQTISKD